MYAGTVYAGGAYAGAGMLDADVPVDTQPKFSVEMSFTTDALAAPVWVDVSGDVRSWDVSRGRRRELERFQPGRATVVLDNRDRDYDSQHAAGPWFGNLRPMRRMRIRGTFNGTTFPVFDGFVDRWNLDYPGVGKDAIATVTATDGFKIFARTELGKSVYVNVIGDDAPPVWYRLDDNQVQFGDDLAFPLNSGTLGTLTFSTYRGPPTLGEQSLIVHDPGSAMSVTDSNESPGTLDMGVNVQGADFDLFSFGSWAIEMWCRPPDIGVSTTDVLWSHVSGGGLTDGALSWNTGSGDTFDGIISNTAAANFEVQSAIGQGPHKLYHVVFKYGPNRVLSLYVNGVKTTGATVTGMLSTGFTVSNFGFHPNPVFNWRGPIDEIAIYTAAQASDPLTDAQVAAHYAAGTHPWQGDLPGARLNRVLDEANWPADLRELDAGQTTFQSAAIDGQTVLEHAQKVAESEAGAVFMSRAGVVRLVDRDVLAARVSQATFGDDAGEVGYRDVKFDDGDATIRNRATISRLNGVARTDEDVVSVGEFGRFQYTLDGLLHDSEAHSIAYAGWVVDNYHEPTRRVVAMDLGPAAAGEEQALYEQMLGRELGDKVTVKQRPPGGGAVFSQDVVIEGISISGSPKVLTATWALSPAPGTF